MEKMNHPKLSVPDISGMDITPKHLVEQLEERKRIVKDVGLVAVPKFTESGPIFSSHELEDKIDEALADSILPVPDSQ